MIKVYHIIVGYSLNHIYHMNYSERKCHHFTA